MIIIYIMYITEIKNEIDKNTDKKTEKLSIDKMSEEILQLKIIINDLRSQNRKLIIENQHLVRLAGGRLL